ncbi:MAG: DUF1580 domain-containing protein [Planctomycetaceae bacterium]|nr:DUF1580 domain-containing protein [Planctomycetaceae bacterium]
MLEFDGTDFIPISQAGKHFPSSRSRATVWRWILNGVRGQKLATILIGGRRFTSAAAIQSFLERLNPAVADDKVGERRRRQAMAAQHQLAARGLKTPRPPPSGGPWIWTGFATWIGNVAKSLSRIFSSKRTTSWTASRSVTPASCRFLMAASFKNSHVRKDEGALLNSDPTRGTRISTVYVVRNNVGVGDVMTRQSRPAARARQLWIFFLNSYER